MTWTLCLAPCAAVGLVLGAHTSSCWFLCTGEHWVSTRGPCWTGGYRQNGGQGAAAGHRPFAHPTLCGERVPPGPVPCPQSWLAQRLCPSRCPAGLGRGSFFPELSEALWFPSLPSHKLLFSSPYCSPTGSSPLSHRLPLLSSCLQVPHQNVAPQYLRGRSPGTARRLLDSQWTRVPLL